MLIIVNPMGDVPTRLGSCTDAAELHFLQGPDAQHVALATPATRLHVDSSRGQLCSSALEEQDLSLARLQFHVKMREHSILSVVYPHMFFEQAQSSPPGQGWHQLSKLLRLDSKLFQDCTNCVKDETRPLYHTYLPTYLHTYIHTDRKTDRQTDIHPSIHIQVSNASNMSVHVHNVRRESGAAAARPRSSWDARDTSAAVLVSQPI